jgi:DNA invertase Pin-like site-specific DNA recombinase
MSAPARPSERLEGKVGPRHRDRLAAVYVRQSAAQQVQDHQESTRLQYGLAERAAVLGWAPSRVLVIDEDLGHSASGADARPGFQQLVSEVGLDHAGIVLGTGMSRLARSGREWHQLLGLCALAGTLLGDPDGIYDPADHNDRLLLGLKGTISEAELYLIKQRMWTGRLAKARRGELAVPLPAGFVRRPSGEAALDPDEQVQAVIRLVFGLFERLGTVNAVLCFLADNHIQLGMRLREGPERGELAWRRPSRAGVQNILRMVHYQRGAGGKLHPVYVCGRGKSDYAAGQCQQLAGPCADAYVTDLLLAAMAPAALEVSLAAAEQAGAQRAEVDRIWRQRLERAEFAADRARRQYQLAEPENRLVVRQLEKDWETALAERQRLGEEYARFTAARPPTLTAAEREQIRALAADLPAVWNAPTTSDADRKQLIRHLGGEVGITVPGTSEKVDVEVTWAGGHRTAGPEPVADHPDKRALRHEAWWALGPVDGMDLRDRADGSLWLIRDQYQAETAWAPKNLSRELGHVRASAEDDRLRAIRSEAEAEVARKAGDRELAARHEQQAERSRCPQSAYRAEGRPPGVGGGDRAAAAPGEREAEAGEPKLRVPR